MSTDLTQKAGSSDLAFVALGANLPFGTGDPASTLRAALPGLQQLSTQPLLVSPFYESAPKDCPPGSPQYSNAVIGISPLPGETPESLLRSLQELEQRFGRVRSGVVNEARTLDLDLLVFHDAVRSTPALVLPHPRAHQRRFVLEPWIAIAGPDFLLHGKSLGEWEFECLDSAIHQGPQEFLPGIASPSTSSGPKCE